MVCDFEGMKEIPALLLTQPPLLLTLPPLLLPSPSQIVCDFEGMENETMYLWNEYDPFRMIPEVLFCYSHLLARIEINAAAPVGESPTL
jgi:hypothetical protein